DAAQGTARQHADHDDAHAALTRAVEEPAEILGGKARRHRGPGARVEQVVADLCGVDRAAVDRLVERPGLAERGHTTEADPSLRAELLHGRNDLAQDVAHAERAAAARRLDAVVELEQVDALPAEPLQARVERPRDRAGDVVQIRRIQAELGPDLHRRLERFQHLAQVALGLAVAVRRRRVEVVDAELHGPRDRVLALRDGAADEQPADVAAAEAERGDPEPRLAEIPQLHCAPPVPVVGNYSPTPDGLSSGRSPRTVGRNATAPGGADGPVS